MLPAEEFDPTSKTRSAPRSSPAPAGGAVLAAQIAGLPPGRAGRPADRLRNRPRHDPVRGPFRQPASAPACRHGKQYTFRRRSIASTIFRAATSASSTNIICSFLAVISVFTKPGQIVVTAMFFDRREMRNALQVGAQARLAGAVRRGRRQALERGDARNADQVAGPPRASIAGRTASMAYIGPSRFVRITRLGGRHVQVGRRVRRPDPGVGHEHVARAEPVGQRLQAVMDPRPGPRRRRPRTRAARRSSAPRSHNWRNRSSRRARTPSVAPRRANSTAIARPSPLDAPVMHTTFPANPIRPALPPACCAGRSGNDLCRLAYFPAGLLGKPANGCHHGKVAFRPYRAFPCGPSSSRPCHG